MFIKAKLLISEYARYFLVILKSWYSLINFCAVVFHSIWFNIVVDSPSSFLALYQVSIDVDVGQIAVQDGAGCVHHSVGHRGTHSQEVADHVTHKAQQEWVKGSFCSLWYRVEDTEGTDGSGY